MSLATIWSRRRDERALVAAVRRRDLLVIVHWRVTEWEDIGGGRHHEKPPALACRLSDQPIRMVVTFAIRTGKRFTSHTSANFKELLTCEACRIMFEGMTER